VKETALERVKRALDLIPFISKNPGLSIEEIARRFGSTPSQISKDLTLLHMCGLPGYSHLELLDIDYENPDFVSVLDAQVLDKPRSLSQPETLTLVLGLQLLSEIATNSDEVEKIKSLKDRLSSKLSEEISHSISISDGVVDSPLVKELQRSLVSRNTIIFTYDSLTSDAVTTREVLSLELDFRGGVGYLRAMTIETRDVRTYRLDRIRDLLPGTPIEVHTDEPTNNERSERLIELKMGRDGLFFIEKHNEIVTSHSQVGNSYFVTVKVNSLEWLTRVIFSWPEKIEVLEPVELAQDLKNRVSATLENYL
jgi:proteasome accessory factor C